jgi:hypothetical protein
VHAWVSTGFDGIQAKVTLLPLKLFQKLWALGMGITGCILKSCIGALDQHGQPPRQVLISGHCLIDSAMYPIDVITTGPKTINGPIPHRLTRPAIGHTAELLLAIRQSNLREKRLELPLRDSVFSEKWPGVVREANHGVISPERSLNHIF